MLSYTKQPKVEFRKKPRAIESGLQQRIVNLWANIAKERHKDCLFAIPNGGMLTEAYRYRLVREGLRAGWPDMGLCLDGGRIVWFECKRPKTYKASDKTGKMIVADSGGTTSEWQRVTHEMLHGIGHSVIVVTDESQFMDWVKMNAREMLKCA